LIDRDAIKQAEMFESKNDWAAAIAIYQQLHSQNATIDVIAKLAWCYSRNGNFKESKKHCSTLVDQDPNNPKWWYLYGYQFYMEQNWSESLGYFEKALKIYPDYFVVLYRAAYSRLKLAGEYLKLTKSDYWKAIGLLDKAHQVWNSFQNDRKEIEKHTYFHINFTHGKALMLIPNRNDDAIKYFNQALCLKDDIDCRYNLAKSLFFANRYDEAKKVLPKEQKFYVIELLASIEYELGNYEEASALVENILIKRKKDYLYNLLSNIKMSQGLLQKAYENAAHSIELNKSNHKNYYTMALVCYKLGLFNKAITSINEAMRIKTIKYKSNYQECEDLKKEIESIMPDGHKDDLRKINSYEDTTDSYNEILTQYDDKKGFGFAFVDNKRVFVHISKVKNGKLALGSRINFRIEETQKGLQAVDISVIH